ncbi:hypothetical protein K432DRAFT_10212 [Lepidopterella palustris CBS 459.81]|uniref:Uncharacterized protein n=1 Tax=Lepidopterella palustris CBS 459.81 TaxID=1314670 RepID=A0A8E2DX73_9PEZI|nr:hypothetical protein K432DRAFT_10212 [Lepidopterella palustris CBS 459.81]
MEGSMAVESAAAAHLVRISRRISARLDLHRPTFTAQLAAAASSHSPTSPYGLFYAFLCAVVYVAFCCTPFRSTSFGAEQQDQQQESRVFHTARTSMALPTAAPTAPTAQPAPPIQPFFTFLSLSLSLSLSFVLACG